MKMIFALCTALLTLNTSVAQAELHTPNYCSGASTQICAHLGYRAPFTTSEEGVFVVHILDQTEVSNLQVSVWMDMGGGQGHGSAPVEVQALGDNHFQVQNAWFVMEGKWLVRITFDSNNQSHEISIPVLVKE